MLRVGVLGAGFMGRTHAHAYAALPDAQVVGVAASTPASAAALAREVGAAPFADAHALVASPDVDAVSITLPTDLHHEYTLAALRAGKHVLLEKPMALTLAECDAMIAAAQAGGAQLMLAHVLRFWPEYVALAELVQSGALGAPLAASAVRLGARWPAGSWFTNPTRSGGAILDLHIHDLDVFNWLFGTPRSVFARGQRGPGGGWDHVYTTVDYGGVVACAEGSMLMPSGFLFTMALRVVCERGAVEYHMRAGGGQVDSRTPAGASLLVIEGDAPPRPLPCATHDAYQAQIAAFVACARTGHPPTQGTAEQGRLAVATALAARRSIEAGQAVAL